VNHKATAKGCFNATKRFVRGVVGSCPRRRFVFSFRSGVCVSVGVLLVSQLLVVDVGQAVAQSPSGAMSAVNKPIVLSGRVGSDVIRGGLGNDLIYGGLGDDKVYGAGGSDTIRGNAGFDVIYGELATDMILGLSHEDFVIYETYRTRGQR